MLVTASDGVLRSQVIKNEYEKICVMPTVAGYAYAWLVWSLKTDKFSAIVERTICKGRSETEFAKSNYKNYFLAT